ncbi:protein of unknown function [Verrucomicrobium sp. GAS474]|uniref:DUF748 domain-containing protein n=1 Tax=Verrucomicrobium sp. GAS474 TaxID=1882831 RepID=UPI00087C5A8D|nr:DUF748 domain-containing protein [Verrucomicrobium sp. GAS474]SDU13144.1 protein of unknown function [Verrucomicrobium sp. GAS474]
MPCLNPSVLRERYRQAPRRTQLWIMGSLIGLVVFLIILRLAASSIVLYSVNRILGGMPDYQGHAESVTLHIWRGAYRIDNLTLQKKSPGKRPEPFIAFPALRFSIEWKALLHGSFVGEVDIDHPRLNLIDSPDEQEKQLTISQTWGEKFKQLFPLQINRLAIHDGELRFSNPRSTPPVDLRMTELQVLGTNLTNGASSKEELSGKIDIRCKVLKTASLKSHIDLNPIATLPDFHLTLELSDVSFPELNNFLLAYAGIDAEKGKMQAYSELRVKNGKLDGYLKPIIEDPSFVKLEDLGDHPLKFLKETIVSAILFFFTNHAHDTVATRIPLEGSVDKPDTNWFTLIGGLLRNAWIEHMKPGLDKQAK